MRDMCRVIDGEADSDEQVDGRHSVDCQVPEVHTATNVNLRIPLTISRLRLRHLIIQARMPYENLQLSIVS